MIGMSAQEGQDAVDGNSKILQAQAVNSICFYFGNGMRQHLTLVLDEIYNLRAVALQPQWAVSEQCLAKPDGSKCVSVTPGKNTALERITLTSCSKHSKSVERRVTGIHNGVEVAGCDAEVESVARLGAAKALGVVELCDVVRVAVVVVRERAAVAHVLDGVQRNAQLAVMRYDSGGAVRVAGVAPATAVRWHGAGMQVE